MKIRLLKIVPVIGFIVFVIYASSCKRTYDSNNIPSASTDVKKSEEIYTGSTNARTESVGYQRKDSTINNQQMEPLNSTGVPAAGSTR